MLHVLISAEEAERRFEVLAPVDLRRRDQAGVNEGADHHRGAAFVLLCSDSPGDSRWRS